MRARKMLVIPSDKENPRKEIVDILKKEHLPYEKIETETIGNEVVVWLHTSWEKKARDILKKYKIKAFTSDISIVEVKNKPGELEKVVDVLSSNGIIIKDVHEILKDKKKAIYGFLTDSPKEAAEILRKYEFLKEGE
jgi:hypothetical protein